MAAARSLQSLQAIVAGAGGHWNGRGEGRRYHIVIGSRLEEDDLLLMMMRRRHL